jgi:hypothetical protein
MWVGTFSVRIYLLRVNTEATRTKVLNINTYKKYDRDFVWCGSSYRGGILIFHHALMD